MLCNSRLHMPPGRTRQMRRKTHSSRLSWNISHAREQQRVCPQMESCPFLHHRTLRRNRVSAADLRDRKQLPGPGKLRTVEWLFVRFLCFLWHLIWRKCYCLPAFHRTVCVTIVCYQLYAFINPCGLLQGMLNCVGIKSGHLEHHEYPC